MISASQCFLLLLLCLFATALASAEQSSNLRGRQTAETRIVGGTQAALNSYPFYIEWAHGCGGVLIHDDLVLTAAHCNAGANIMERFEVYVGGDGSHHSGTPMFATAGYEHPRYNPRLAHAYDFMVLQLPQKIENIPFAIINSNPNYPTEGTPLTVIGHGLMDENDLKQESPDILRQVTIPYIEDCSSYYRQVRPGVQFCAGDMPQGGKDACQGDSGSGIFDADGVLVGLVSWGIGCAQQNRPGVYGRVSVIERWLEHMKCQASAFPPAHCTKLQVTMTVDDYPEELGLSILDADSGSPQPEAVVMPAGTLGATLDRQTLQYTFSVPKGRNYVLRVQDTHKDGFCCAYGQGAVTVTDVERTLQYTIDANFATEYASVALPMVGGPTPTQTTQARATSIDNTTRV